MRPSSPGFTVAELLLVALLGALVMLGLASIFSSTYRFMTQGHDQNRSLGEAAMTVKSISKDLRETTVLYRPNPGCVGTSCDRLLGCTNYDPFLFTRIDPRASVPIRCYLYCINSVGEMWYTFQNEPSAYPPSGSLSTYCEPADAKTWSGGSAPIRLAFKIRHYSTPNTTPPRAREYFERDFNNLNIRNLIEVTYVVGTSTVNTSVTMLMPVVSP